MAKIGLIDVDGHCKKPRNKKRIAVPATRWQGELMAFVRFTFSSAQL